MKRSEAFCLPRPDRAVSYRPDRSRCVSLFKSLAGQADAEARGGELQQDLTRCLQGGNLGPAQLLQLSQDTRVSVGALLASPAEHNRVRPYLFPRLAQEALGAEPVERPEQP